MTWLASYKFGVEGSAASRAKKNNVLVLVAVADESSAAAASSHIFVSQECSLSEVLIVHLVK